MKLKRIVLSFLMVISMFCIAACKDKEESGPPSVQEKQDPVITVRYNDGLRYYAGNMLETVELVLVEGGTPGTVAWESPTTTLELGTKSYKWLFVPTDADKYNSKTGSLEVTARTPLITPTVSGVKIKDGQDIYIDSVLSMVELDENFASSVAGMVVWANPNKTLNEGENVCAWVFIPADSDTYSRVTGTLTVNATQNQYLSSISVKSNTRASGYVAYDKFDCSGLTLTLSYNSGKEVTTKVTNAECAVTYKNGDSLRQGDTSVTIQYQTQTCEVVIDTVAYKIVEKPEFTDVIVYDGFSHTLTVEESKEGYYTIGDAYGIEAGNDYELTLTLTDSNNLKWPDSETADTIVLCSIQEAEHVINKKEQTFEYDGEGHAATVEGAQVSAVYYSHSELNEQNYSLADTTPIEFINAGNHTVFYYAVGNKNYKDMTGSLSFTITKQIPVMVLDYAYSLYTGSQIHYPSEYVKMQDKDGTIIPTGSLKFTYYNSYSETPTEAKPNEKTDSLSSGSPTIGGAPVYHKETVYYVVVEYLGDNQNYDVTQGYTELFIDVVDNGFYAEEGENEFAFKIMEDGDLVTFKDVVGFSIAGTNSKECDAYVKFSKVVNQNTHLTELLFDAKFGTGEGCIKSGKLAYITSEYQLVFDDGSTSMIIELGESDDLTVYFPASQTKVLSKWEIPNFNLVSYTAKTVADDAVSDANTTQNTTFTFYNDYGTIRFSADVNVESHQSGIIPNAPVVGGHETWGGIVVVGIERDENKSLCYTLSCYIINSAGLSSEGFSKEGSDIKFRWLIPIESEQTIPSTLEVYGGSKLTDWIYEDLKTSFNKV